MGFWGSLAKFGPAIGSIAAAPFTAGTSLAWLPQALAGASAVTGGLLANRKTKEEQLGLQSLTDLQKRAATLSDVYSTRGREVVDPTIAYWRNLASGDRATVMGELAPDIQNIEDVFGSAFRSQQELIPRGGGRSALLANLPFEKARQIATLAQTLRPESVTKLASMGINLAELGVRAAGEGRLGAMGLLDIGQKNRASAVQTGLSIGQTLAGILFGGGDGKGKTGTETGDEKTIFEILRELGINPTIEPIRSPIPGTLSSLR